MNIDTLANKYLASKKVLVTLLVAWTLMTLYLTLLPTKYIGHFQIYHHDKIGHAGMFLGWSYLMGLFLHYKGKLTNKVLILTCGSGALFGGLVEILQYLMPFHRDAQIGDFIADSIGCTIAFLLLLYTRKKIHFVKS